MIHSSAKKARAAAAAAGKNELIGRVYRIDGARTVPCGWVLVTVRTDLEHFAAILAQQHQGCFAIVPETAWYVRHWKAVGLAAVRAQQRHRRRRCRPHAAAPAAMAAGSAQGTSGP